MAGKISEMTTAPSLTESDLLEIAQPSAGSVGGYATFKTTLNAIAIKILTGITFNAFGNKTVVDAVVGTVLTDTLEAGETTLTFTDNAITISSTFDFYTDTFGVNPTAVSVSAGSITLTFEEQSSDVEVKVVVK